MGADPLTVGLVGGALLGGAASAVGAVQQSRSAREQARRAEDQAAIAAREAEAEAARQEKESDKFRRRQKLAFLKSGVSLAGSPLLILDETRKLGAEQAFAVRQRGGAQASLLRSEASTLRRQGRAGLFSGLLSAGSSTLSTVGIAGSLRSPAPKKVTTRITSPG